MNFWEIFLYSFIQGVTEFLPISSSAHLFLLENIFLIPDDRFEELRLRPFLNLSNKLILNFKLSMFYV